jgi:hypothetical protein
VEWFFDQSVYLSGIVHLAGNHVTAVVAAAAAATGCRNQALHRNLRDLEPSRQGEERGEPGDAHRRLTLCSPCSRGCGEREDELDADLTSFLLPRECGWRVYGLDQNIWRVPSSSTSKLLLKTAFTY